MADILFLDDDPSISRVALDYFEIYGLDAVSFFSGVEALSYLHAPDRILPLAYLCDMQIKGSPAELASSLTICEFVRSRGSLDYFRFFTGHVSEHDLEVLRLTAASVIVKPGNAELKEFLEAVQARRDALGKA